MTEITNTNTAPAEARSIESITAEINTIRGHVRRVVLEAGIEIGRRLVEAKEMLPYGEWGAWLKEKVDFSQDGAERLMKIYRGYADKQTSLFGAELESATLRNLSISNALLLLKIPEDEREAFAEEHDAENLSARELDRIIKEHGAREKELTDQIESARAERDEAKEQFEASEKLRAELSDKLAGNKAELEAAQRQIRELESRPIDVAVQEPDPAEIQKRIDDAVDEAVDEALKNAKEDNLDLSKKLAAADHKRAELEAQEKKLKEKLAAAEKDLAAAKKEAEDQAKAAAEKEKALIEQQAGVTSLEKERLEREIEALKKQISMSDAAVVTFNTLFAQAQDIMNRLTGAIAKVDDAETGAKLRAATRKLLEVYGEKVGA